MARPLSLGSLVAVASLLASCGGAGPDDLHSTFARIQVEEARIEHAEGAARDAADCPEGELVCAEVCDAARAVGELAAAVDDRDARARADRAEARCGACRAALEPRCGGSP